MYDLTAISKFVTRENIQSLINQSGLSGRIGLLSTDIDGVDYWVLEKITSEADIIIVEFNDFLGDLPVSVPYSPDFSRFTASPHGSYWGASLSAFRYLLEARGYIFTGTNRLGVNAFFVHADHGEALSKHLEKRVHHPYKMREARDHSGNLAYKPYAAFQDNIVHLPVIRVNTNETVPLGSVCRKR